MIIAWKGHWNFSPSHTPKKGIPSLSLSNQSKIKPKKDEGRRRRSKKVLLAQNGDRIKFYNPYQTSAIIGSQNSRGISKIERHHTFSETRLTLLLFGHLHNDVDIMWKSLWGSGKKIHFWESFARQKQLSWSKWPLEYKYFGQCFGWELRVWFPLAPKTSFVQCNGWTRMETS